MQKFEIILDKNCRYRLIYNHKVGGKTISVPLCTLPQLLRSEIIRELRGSLFCAGAEVSQLELINYNNE